MRFFKAMFLVNYKEILSSGDWRDAMRSAVSARDHDIILEVPATTLQMSEPLMTQHSNVTFASLGASPQTDPNRQVKFENEKLDCSGASFDKIACCMALHPLPSAHKLTLLKELRRVLRQGGTLYVADFDRPHTHRETIALNGTDYLFGSDSADIHHQGALSKQIELAGFSHVKRLHNEANLVGRVSIFRARR